MQSRGELLYEEARGGKEGALRHYALSLFRSEKSCSLFAVIGCLQLYQALSCMVDLYT